MFSKKIIHTDVFLEMPKTSQLLYFHLCMDADDEGFVGTPRQIMKAGGFNDDDFNVLLAKRYILNFKSGIVVIKHWLIHNTIRSDRAIKTTYEKEKNMLKLNEFNAYTEDDNQVATKRHPSIDKIRLDKISIDKVSRERTPSQFAKEFFSNNDLQDKVSDELSIKGGINSLTIKNEITKFVHYWTEPNKSGTKERWELQPTFDIQRRLTTWLNKIKDFNKKHKNYDFRN